MIPYWLIQLTKGLAPTLVADLCDTFYVGAESGFSVPADPAAFAVSADLGAFSVAADLPAFAVPGCGS